MKKLSKIVLAVLIPLLFIGNAHAMYVMPSDGNSLLGETDYYSVYLRGNGETVVSFRSQFTNTSDNPVSTVSYQLPGTVTAHDLIAYQVNQSYSRPCFEPMMEKTLPMGQSSSGVTVHAATVTPSTTISPKVDQNTGFYPPCYVQQYGNAYIKAGVHVNGQTLVIDLPTPVAVNDTVNFFVSFRTFDYVKKELLGTFTYTFKTLQSERAIDSLQVGIAADQDYVLKDAKGTVNYNTASSAVAPVPMGVGDIKNVYNQQLDTYFNRIGQGTVYKYASNLSPKESFIVKGIYADSTWKLYLSQIVFGFVIAVFILICLIILTRKIVTMKHAKNTEKQTFLFWSNLSETHQSFLVSAGAALVGATLAVLYSILLFLFTTTLLPQLFYWNGFEQIFILLLFVVSFGIYAALLFIPALLVGMRRHLAWGITTFVFTIVWLLFYLVVVFILYFSLFSQRDMPVYPTIMEGVGKVQAVPPTVSQ